jgi:hypothetical protein
LQRKYYLFVLAITLLCGAFAAVTTPVEASTVRFYVYPETPIAAVLPGGYVAYEVRIESPPEWENTTQGIVGWALSMRGDPRALEPFGAGKIGGMAGFLEDFLVTWGYDWDYVTGFYSGASSAETCTFFDISEQIQGYGTLGVGAGGSGRLFRGRFKSRSDVIASVIDVFGPPTSMLQAQYLTVDGVWHDADVVDDGYYIAETPATYYFDSSAGYDPTSPMYTDWHELWPVLCNWWSLESWEDNTDGSLSESDQIDLVQTDGPHPGEVVWGHVEWVNPTPVAGDGQADLIINAKVPEFPLGMAPMLVLVLAIPVVYLWRSRREA